VLKLLVEFSKQQPYQPFKSKDPRFRCSGACWISSAAPDISNHGTTIDSEHHERADMVLTAGSSRIEMKRAQRGENDVQCFNKWSIT
jgi:hypothetical protein